MKLRPVQKVLTRTPTNGVKGRKAVGWACSPHEALFFYFTENA